MHELGALVGRGADADDPDAVALGLMRLLLMTVEDTGDHLHLVVLREPLAELGEEVRGGLNSRPVVLVEDEEPRSAVSLHRLGPG